MQNTLRNRHNPLFFAVVLLMLVLIAGTAGAEKLTLEQSINIALENNPAIHIARENTRKADALVREAFSAGYPKVTLNAVYQRLDEATTANFGGSTIVLNKADNRSANLNVSHNVDLFGTVKLGKTAAKAGKSAYQYYLDAQINDITLNVKNAFYNVLRAQQNQQVQNETVSQLDAHLKDAQENFDAGTIAKYDVLRAETEVANARQRFISAKNGVDLAKAALNNVMGRPVSTEIDLEEPARKPFVTLDLNKAIDTASKSRPEVLAAADMIKVNDEFTAIAKKNLLPSLNAQWTLNHNFDTSVFNSRKESWTAMLTAKMSIFDGGFNKAKIDEAKVDANNSRSAKDQIILGVTLDAQQSYLSLNESQERIKTAETALVQANEAYRLANVRYKNGVSTQLEVLDTETALTAAKMNLVNALYDYQVALAELERAVGGSDQMASLISKQ